MKKILLLTLLMTSAALAHDHVEVGTHPANPGQLALDGPGVQLAPYVPVGEFFSGYTSFFSGGCFASELTFTTENSVLDAPIGANPEIELVSITGPADGSFSFWEINATSPTWSRGSGWTQTSTDRPSFPVILGDNNHLHGRAFSVDRPGEYQVTFRAVDRNALFQNSADYTLAFRALAPPPLSIRLSGGQAVISFTSRLGLTYDLQSRTNLGSGAWDLANATPIDGDGNLKEIVLPLSHPRAFFRLIEFK
jgi:hypothetical protein